MAPFAILFSFTIIPVFMSIGISLQTQYVTTPKFIGLTTYEVIIRR